MSQPRNQENAQAGREARDAVSLRPAVDRVQAAMKRYLSAERYHVRPAREDKPKDSR